MREEERQLMRNTLRIIQDSIVDKGLKTSLFKEHMLVHYDDNRPSRTCPIEFLKNKWDQIKNDGFRSC